MARLLLIFAAAMLLFAAPPVRADELKPDEFPVSNERMAELIELAAEGNLTVPDITPTKDPAAWSQITFLGVIVNARKTALLDRSPDTADGQSLAAEKCYRAVMAARAGNYYAADILLEEGFTTRFDRHDYCLFLYQRWNDKALSYRFLRWWARHVSGSNDSLGLVMLIAAGQLLALPLLLKLRHAIKAGRRGRALIGPALAAAFVEGVPLCWAAANGPAWEFAYQLNEPFSGMMVLHFAVFIVFIVCACGATLSDERTVLGIALSLGGIFYFFPFAVLRNFGLLSLAGQTVGVAFWSGSLAVLIYFLLLLRRERGSLQRV